MDKAFRDMDLIAPQLFEQLRSAIVEMRLAPGSALSEKEVSERYGVSRQPVREAFIKLSEAGLVEVRPSRGTFVRKISVREVADARFVREAVECSLVRYACRFITDADCDSLRGLVDNQKRAALANDFASFNANDEDFHRCIGNIVQCDYALRTVVGARNQIDRVRFLSLGDATPMQTLISQHGDIVAALAARDADAAERAMRRHLREVLIALPRLARANPDIFKDYDLPAHTLLLMPDEDAVAPPVGQAGRE
ncbi:DNA-binding GntR family transcriptional regulator [Hoeflea marina]|uniref:DNA-binding GntR family transcriptional regulator n=1 Tax=Hoeflea marina TaxID=274592 RepID=A0A317PNZ4_9HYPH|nr:GntR family transcriptional regulator [Hoeflea marina]PWW01698.1 DNA-binding GntR family transcriptional regulator [Hoeflea marina]